MKTLKKISYTISLLLICVTWIADANWDSVSSVTYKAPIKQPYNMEVKTKNIACPQSPEKTFKKDILGILNVASNELDCWKDGTQVLCQRDFPNYWPPPWTKVWSFYVSSSKSQILKELWLPSSAYSSVTGNYVQNFELELALRTNSNWGDTGWQSPYFFSNIANPFYLFSNNRAIEYNDPTECSWNSCDPKKENCTPVIPPPDCVPTATNDCWMEISTGKKPATIGTVDLPSCTWDSATMAYVCYASDNLTISAKLSNLWRTETWAPVWINKLNLSFNNCSNTQQVVAPVSKNINLTNVWISDVSDFTWTSYRTAWCYSIDVYWKYSSDNAYITNAKTFKIYIVPNNKITTSWTPQVTWWWYANNADSYTICQNVKDEFWNTISANYWAQSATLSWWLFFNTWYWTEWLNLHSVTFNNSVFCIKAKSVSPWISTAWFALKVPQHSKSTSLLANWSYTYLKVTANLTFKRSVWWSLSIDDQANFSIWTQESAKVNLTKAPWFNSAVTLSWYLSSFSTTNPNYKMQSKSIAPWDPVKINFILNYIGWEWWEKTGVKANPYVVYNLWWENVTYQLSLSDSPSDNSQIKSTDTQIKAISITGKSQWSWKMQASNQTENFSDLSTSSQRTQIKQNIEKLLKWRTPDDKKINSIYYSDWTKRISSILPLLSANDTVVIRNGNLIIDQNIPSSLWIAVFRNSQADLSKWNIMIRPNVALINILAYADWSLLSINSSDAVYSDTQASSNNELKQQLVIKGSIFTRNTIWWALWDNVFLLPGGAKTTVFEEAVKYDLNFLRRRNIWYDSASWTANYNNWKTENVVIIYNPEIAANPPKWFGK
ncbi:MAG: hypothetical protein ACD_2C00182G0016 [uncultured bacterium (gcode 4)]|uniref:Uncharacterized protein n=1 Tax=uncultured bacterium (gcode 4) TaxID=1234023 RepID=K2FE18_9BACT|nr:MAG: hypothetical protein ACD_2C00182G0016 [uncultured bacterium (gcode 4)]